MGGHLRSNGHKYRGRIERSKKGEQMAMIGICTYLLLSTDINMYLSICRAIAVKVTIVKGHKWYTFRSKICVRKRG